MMGSRMIVVRRVCMVGRFVAVLGLVLCAVIMTSVASDPASLGAWTAAGVFATICLAFMTDRFLSSALDRVDRFGVPTTGSESVADGRGSARERLRDAA